MMLVVFKCLSLSRCVLLFFLLVFVFFRGLSFISSVRYFFVEAYLFKNICQMEIFLTVYLPKECLLNKQSVFLCKVSKTLRILKKPCLLNQMSFYIIIPKRVLFRKNIHLGHSLLLFSHLHLISLTTQNKLNLENDRILEQHKKKVKLK